MYRDRYRPKKYEHFRRRRLRNRMVRGGIVVAALVLVVVAVLLLGRAMGFGRSAAVVASVSPAQTQASVSALISSSPSPTALTTAMATDGTSSYPTATDTGGDAAVAVPPPTTAASPTPSVSASASASISPTPTATAQSTVSVASSTGVILNPAGVTIETRFNPPQGYQRAALTASSFGAWLRGHALLGDGVAPKRWDGKDAPLSGSAAVLNMDVTSPLQQATETAIRLHAQYLYETNQSDKIAYHFASGFPFQWSRWSAGERLNSIDRNPTWRNEAAPDSSPANLAAYLDLQYNYTNIHSLTTLDLAPVSLADLAPGDLLVNLRGSVAFVADMAANSAGQRVALLLSGGTPARQLTILDNPGSKDKPWYVVPADGKGTFRLNDYSYDWGVLMRFRP